ncbi:hypothetical protein B0H14DRAFT_3477006 [Mycena olivaceomarginata]|nr:hypothetical protein B0H14DRAFT_3477006 [Mycena olivaceomarginata]
MRKHIAKALQARSKVVRNAIDRYNSAASLLDPPMRQLTWEQVVEYAFLVDFDILQDTRAEIRSRSWTRPGLPAPLWDRYFKILRVREEIRRLNIEIPRVVTWIRDENCILHRKEAELNSVEKTEEEAAADQGMAVQVRLLPRASGTLRQSAYVEVLGVGKDAGIYGLGDARSPQADGERVGPEGASGGIGMEHEGDEEMVVDGGDEGEWVEEDEGDDAMEAAVSDLLYTISMVAIDDRGEPPQVQES